jgi:hypothetical protein
MIRGVCERAVLAVTLAWLCAAGCGPAMAQTPATATVDFDIPAQPMAAALNSWAVQANAQVFVDPAPVAHLMAPAVKGSLTPRQALRALLARSNLQVTRGADGVFVIKPGPALVAAPAPATPGPPESPAPSTVAPAGALTARALEGPWLVGVLAEYAVDDGAATGGASAAVTGEYFIADHVAAALAVTAPRTHHFDGESTRLQSSDLSLKYYFAPDSRLRPYLDAGIDVTTLYDANGAAGVDRVAVGAALDAGIDFSLSPHWLLNAGVGWAQVRPGVQIGLGFNYRFGR